jgi:hypothetical protein
LLFSTYWMGFAVWGTLNMKNTARKSLHKESKTDCSMKPQYSVTSEYSTVKGTPKHIREWLNSLPEGSPAKISHAPARVQESTENGLDSGLKCGTPYASLDPDTFSLKTSQCSLFGDLNTSSVRFSKWGMMQSGELYRLPMSERVTSESGCGLWPAPRKSDGEKGTRSLAGHRKERLRRGNGVDLPTAICFPTPNVPNGGRAVPKDAEWHGTRTAYKQDGKKIQVGLESCLKKWPTPAEQDCKNSTFPVSQRNRDTVPGAMIRDGQTGSLNPDWVEWLMNWPIGWSSLEPIEKLRWEPIDQEPLDIPRVAANIKDRVNRLKAIGNGQCPQSAATAWKILSDTEGERMGT